MADLSSSAALDFLRFGGFASDGSSGNPRARRHSQLRQYAAGTFEMQGDFSIVLLVKALTHIHGIGVVAYADQIRVSAWLSVRQWPWSECQTPFFRVSSRLC